MRHPGARLAPSWMACRPQVLHPLEFDSHCSTCHVDDLHDMHLKLRCMLSSTCKQPQMLLQAQFKY